MAISARLFPPRVIAKARALVSPELHVRFLSIDGERVRVQVAATGDLAARDANQAFKAALTVAAIMHFCGRPRLVRAGGAAAPPDGLGARRVRLSMEISGDQVMVALEACIPVWHSVLRALGRLRLARPVVETTDPVDRVVLLLQLRDGGPVEEALREFLALLREELSGPAA